MERLYFVQFWVPIYWTFWETTENSTLQLIINISCDLLNIPLFFLEDTVNSLIKVESINFVDFIMPCQETEQIFTSFSRIIIVPQTRLFSVHAKYNKEMRFE